MHEEEQTHKRDTHKHSHRKREMERERERERVGSMQLRGKRG